MMSNWVAILALASAVVGLGDFPVSHLEILFCGWWSILVEELVGISTDELNSVVELLDHNLVYFGRLMSIDKEIFLLLRLVNLVRAASLVLIVLLDSVASGGGGRRRDGKLILDFRSSSSFRQLLWICQRSMYYQSRL